ncbi:T9SS type A sorting domain-containing protein [candidate division KSB1 bacterium]|nr:T9SS type A sorting domain-containing protein [candidate division KSB1 bacterium]
MVRTPGISLDEAFQWVRSVNPETRGRGIIEVQNPQSYVHLASGTGVRDLFASLPAVFALGQNYPNPFNPVTVIPFELPEEGHISINIFNNTGQIVYALADARFSAGFHEVLWDATSYSSGVYYVRMRAGETRFVSKGLLVR